MKGDASATTGDGAAGPELLLSACIIARDEEEALPDCLASVAFCDEIVLVDSGSTDRTVQIAEAAGARVVHQPWLGYAAQRNVALDHARGRWVLEVDCDQRVTPLLREELERFVRQAPDDVHYGGIPVLDHVKGHPLRESSKYPKYRHHLVRRGAQRHDERRTVHEGLVPDGPVHPFTGHFHHLLADTWRGAVADTWRYAKLDAAQLHAPRSPGAVVKGAFVRPAAKAAYRTVVDGGWHDGAYGMAKIALDCGADTAVWLLHATRGAAEPEGDSGRTAGQHYGAWTFRRGEARLVGVAYGARDAEAAERFLLQARALGADVALVTDEAADGPVAPRATAGVRRRRVGSAGPLALARALDAEEQLRSYDALLTFGARAGRLGRAIPGRLRGARCFAAEDITPAAAREAALAARPPEDRP